GTRSVQVTLDAEGNVSVSTPVGFDTTDDEDGVFSFVYEIIDAEGLTDTATVTINVDDLPEPTTPTTFKLSGTVTPQTVSTEIVVLMDLTTSVSDFSGPGGDLNGDGFQNGMDTLINSVLDLASDLSSAGRGAEMITVIPVGQFGAGAGADGNNPALTAYLNGGGQTSFTADEIVQAIDFFPNGDNAVVDYYKLLDPAMDGGSLVNLEAGLMEAIALLDSDDTIAGVQPAETVNDVVFLTGSEGIFDNSIFTPDGTDPDGDGDYSPDSPFFDYTGEVYGLSGDAAVPGFSRPGAIVVSDPTQETADLEAAGVDIDVVTLDQNLANPGILDALDSDGSSSDGIGDSGFVLLPLIEAQPDIIEVVEFKVETLDSDGNVVATDDTIDLSDLLNGSVDVMLNDDESLNLVFGLDTNGDRVADQTEEVAGVIDTTSDTITFNLDLDNLNIV
ncbi:MAG: hypothetical protein AAGA26_01415, partial [Pseudomonadota bacterium]